MIVSWCQFLNFFTYKKLRDVSSALGHNPILLSLHNRYGTSRTCGSVCVSVCLSELRRCSCVVTVCVFSAEGEYTWCSTLKVMFVDWTQFWNTQYCIVRFTHMPARMSAQTLHKHYTLSLSLSLSTSSLCGSLSVCLCLSLSTFV